MDLSTGQPTRSQGAQVDCHDSSDRAVSKRSSIIAAGAVQEGTNKAEVVANGSLSQPKGTREVDSTISSSADSSTSTADRRTRAAEPKAFVDAKIVDGGSSTSATVGGGSGVSKAPTMLPSLTSPVMSPSPDSPKAEESADDDATPLAQEPNTQSGEGRTCINCRRSKVKCNRSSPCSRCARLKLECIAQTRGRGRPVASHKKSKVEPASPASVAGAGEVGGPGATSDRPLVPFPSFMGGILLPTASASPGVASPAADLGRGAQLHQTAVPIPGVGPGRGGEDVNTNNSFGFTGDINPAPTLLAPSQGFAPISGSDTYRDASTSFEPGVGSSAVGNSGSLPPQHQIQVAPLTSPQHGHLDAFEACRPFPAIMTTAPPPSASTRPAPGGLYGIPAARSLPLPLPLSGSGQPLGSERSWQGMINGVDGAGTGGGGGGGGDGNNNNGGEDQGRQASTPSNWEINNSVATASRGGTGVGGGSNSGGGGKGSKTSAVVADGSSANDAFSSSSVAAAAAAAAAERRDSANAAGTDGASARAGFPTSIDGVSCSGGEGKRNSLTAGLSADGSDHHQQCHPEPLACLRDSNGSGGGRGMAALWGGAVGHGKGGGSNRPDSRRDTGIGSGGCGEGLNQRPTKRGRVVGMEQDSQQQQVSSSGAAPLPAFPVASGPTEERGNGGRDAEGRAPPGAGE